MASLSREVRRLQSTWNAQNGWPKRLNWLEIEGIRGWTGQRFEMAFPIMAVVGENGLGKSTVLQAAASIYATPDGRDRFASDFFPSTPWDEVSGAEIRYEVQEGSSRTTQSVRKPSHRWRGNPERRTRQVQYIDLSRIQPVPARVGYSRLANPAYREVTATSFDEERLKNLSGILGRTYDSAWMSITDTDDHRRVPVIASGGATYSGFHQGAGETTIAELLEADLPKYSLVLIDELESSLHPRAQRRLVRDLAEKCRVRQLQIILTTHSPYVLEELPDSARACIIQSGGERRVIFGVSPEFAMTKMDEVAHREIDVYVEDERAATLLMEILTVADRGLVQRCQSVPFGSASVGLALGQMSSQGRFPRRSIVFLDGDNQPAPGCHVLPGQDAPERVVFEGLQDASWMGLNERVGRDFPEVADACSRAMRATDHHDWVRDAAGELVLSSDTLWQAMCAQWATSVLEAGEARSIATKIQDALVGISGDAQSDA